MNRNGGYKRATIVVLLAMLANGAGCKVPVREDALPPASEPIAAPQHLIPPTALSYGPDWDCLYPITRFEESPIPLAPLPAAHLPPSPPLPTVTAAQTAFGQQ
jgi:hypothetical protein